MTQIVDYVGPADIRIITSAQLLSAGIVSADLIWNKANNFERVVDDATAAYLLAADQRFVISTPAPAGFSEIISGNDSNITLYNGFGDQWKQAKTEAGTRRLEAAILSDSIGVGEQATAPITGGWVGKFRTAGQAALGNGGSGWITHNYRPSGYVTTTGSWNDVDTGPGFRGIQPAAPSNGAIITMPINGTNVDLYFRSDPSFGTFHYQIDGGSFVAVNLNPASSVLKVPVTSLAPGAHTVAVRATTGTGIFYGVRAYNSTGLVVDNFSLGGKQAQDLGLASAGLTGPIVGGNPDTGQNTTAWRTLAIPTNLDLVILSMGANDALTNFDDTTLSKLWNALNNAYAASVNFGPATGSVGIPDWVVVAEHVGKHDNFLAVFSQFDYDWLQMYSMLRDFALTIGAAFVDVWSSGKRSWKYWQGLGYWGTGNTDPVHPGDTGHQAYADMINGLLL